MCHPAVFAFAREAIKPFDVIGKRVLEVGSLNVNGSLRDMVTALRPVSYLGVDLQGGPGVDEICDCAELVHRYGPATFDLVISTEMLEHVSDWTGAFHNLKGVTREGGVTILTTRSPGFPRHEFPGDYWRYTTADMAWIMSDFKIEILTADPEAPGVFLKARKPKAFREKVLTGYQVRAVEPG